MKTFLKTRVIPYTIIIAVLVIVIVIIIKTETDQSKKTNAEDAKKAWVESNLLATYGRKATYYRFISNPRNDSVILDFTIDGATYKFYGNFKNNTGVMSVMNEFFARRTAECTIAELLEEGLLTQDNVGKTETSFDTTISRTPYAMCLPMTASEDVLEEFLRTGEMKDYTISVCCKINVTFPATQRLTKDVFTKMKDRLPFLEELVLVDQTTPDGTIEYHYYPKEDKLRTVE